MDWPGLNAHVYSLALPVGLHLLPQPQRDKHALIRQRHVELRRRPPIHSEGRYLALADARGVNGSGRFVVVHDQVALLLADSSHVVLLVNVDGEVEGRRDGRVLPGSSPDAC